MKQLKYSIPIRFTAVILAAVFAAVTAAGTLTALLTYQTGLYTSPLKQVISKNFHELQEFYSVKLLANSENNLDCLENTNLEYGIIQGGEKKDLDLNDKSAYKYYNFKKTTPGKDSAVFSYKNKADYYNENPTLLESLLNKYHYFFSHDEPEELFLETILYNDENGVLYFKSTDQEPIFPIYHISLSSIYATPKKDTAKKQNAQKPLSGYLSFTLDPDTLKYEADADGYEALDTSKYLSWQRFTTQANYWFHAGDIKAMSEEEKTLMADINSSSIWLTRNNKYDKVMRGIKYLINYYKSDMNSPENTIHIISNVTEPLDLQKNDLFVQQKRILTFLYNFRIPCLVITICSFLCFLLLSVFCCYSTGCRADTAFVPVTWLHKMPLFFFLAGTGLCTGGFVFSSIWCLHKLACAKIMNKSFFILFILCVFLAALILVLSAMNLSRRYKAGILWKNTLTCTILSALRSLFSRIISKARRCQQFLESHTSLLVKGITITVAISLIEALLVFVWINISIWGIILWLLLKTVLLILVVNLLIQMKQLQTGSSLLAEGKLNYSLDTSHMLWEFKKHGENLNRIGDGMAIALEERMKSEHFRTELITNVSHDIKTPLTSIINYIDLLQKENISPKTAQGYLEVLERQSARLKKLIEDLMEASKASTGNLNVNLEPCDIDILLTQIFGEFEEKLFANQLELVTQSPDSTTVLLADNRHLWRIFENLMNNICKYSQPGTRVYVSWEADDTKAHIIFRNISKYALNISGEALLERFVRGDTSRSTEGNGLGLSIAQSLAELMDGTLKINTDGDLFKVTLTFPREAACSN
ncbi:sensor histidine kinase [bacterium D16-51]|nr:sensor histidine kinase [bacterium D16-59]RKI57450.1 sensor histidine kinase [bacterium D16-51]